MKNYGSSMITGGYFNSLLFRYQFEEFQNQIIKKRKKYGS